MILIGVSFQTNMFHVKINLQDHLQLKSFHK